MQKALDKLITWGAAFADPSGTPISGGIQGSLTVVFNNDGEEVEFCTHECNDIKGGYKCPARRSANQNIRSSFAKPDTIVRWFTNAAAGLRLANKRYVNGGKFEDYCREWNIPTPVQDAFREVLLSELVEANLFGGEPEIHPQCLEICRDLKAAGLRVNLTTTGRKPLLQSEFRAKLGDPELRPHLLALSTDDVEFDRLPDVLSQNPAHLAATWKGIDKDHGQGQKFVEAIGTFLFAVDSQSTNRPFPPLLFNSVMHDKNLEHFRSMITMLQQKWPQVIINPYPSQGSFSPERPKSPYTADHLALFRELVSYFIEQALNGNRQFTRRLPYWLALLAILNCWHRGEITLELAAAMIYGYGTWHCGRSSNPGYVQIARGRPFQQLVQFGRQPGPAASLNGRQPGGHLGCFWEYTTVTELGQIESAEQVAEFLLTGRQRMLAEAGDAGCEGCIMPRLESITQVAVESNLEFHRPILGYRSNPTIPEYRNLRLEYMDF